MISQEDWNYDTQREIESRMECLGSQPLKYYRHLSNDQLMDFLITEIKIIERGVTLRHIEYIQKFINDLSERAKDDVC